MPDQPDTPPHALPGHATLVLPPLAPPGDVADVGCELAVAPVAMPGLAARLG